MLNKKYRFHSRGGVQYVYQKGKTIRKPLGSLVFVKNERGFTRFAVVVSKKVLKTAVDRNRVRRRVYETIRQNFTKLPQSHDYIFIIHDKKVKDIPYSELEEFIASLIREM